MNRYSRQNTIRSAIAVAVLTVGIVALTSTRSAADEAGVSFWLPGQYGSLAATPAAPGFSLPVIYYHTSVDANPSIEFPIGGAVVAGLEADANLMIAVPTYVFAKPVLGGQLAVSMTALMGQSTVTAEVTLTGPRGNVISGLRRDSIFGAGDLYPTASLKWNDGTSNFMLYTTAGVPVGDYKVGRLANIGTNHWSIDAGGGYTYFNPTNGREFSAVAGVTYNFENDATDYQNGADFHLDWGASQFFSKQLHVGIVGYWYQQISGDSGAGAVLGDFKSRVAGVGPQVGYIFTLGGRQAYFNIRGYYEFAAKYRTEGWNGWLVLSIPLSTPKMAAAPVQ